MPKKQPRNAFYFYMVDFKEQQKKKGVNYGNMAQVAEAAGPLWRDAPPAVRTKFETIAKNERQKNNIPEQKYTSTGISFADIERMEKEVRDAEATEVKDILNFVKLNSFNSNEGLINADIYVMDVNSYCLAKGDYLIGESTLLRFNLVDGIKDIYHEIINPPGGIPLGYAREVKLSCEEFGLEMPDDSRPRSQYMQILANIIDFLKKSNTGAKTLPPIYTMPEKVPCVANFIHQMCYRAAEDDLLFRVYKLDTLFFNMINAIKTRPDEGFPKQSLALVQLQKDLFKYSPGLECEHHTEFADGERAAQCSASRARRLAYTVLDACCPVAGTDMRAGRHLPHDYDVDSILTYKEQKRDRPGPSVAGTSMISSSCNSSVSDCFNNTTAFNSTVLNASSDNASSKTRTYEPLRKPKTDYSQMIRPAPELTDADLLSGFSKMATTSTGHGRGRGLASNVPKRPN